MELFGRAARRARKAGQARAPPSFLSTSSYCTRSQPEGDKHTERSKLWWRRASAVEWLAGEAKPPGVKWLSY